MANFLKLYRISRRPKLENTEASKKFRRFIVVVVPSVVSVSEDLRFVVRVATFIAA